MTDDKPAFDQKAYNMAYAREMLERHSLNFNRATEADLIAWLKSRGEPFAAYVKRLIREDMAKSKAEPGA